MIFCLIIFDQQIAILECPPKKTVQYWFLTIFGLLVVGVFRIFPVPAKMTMVSTGRLQKFQALKINKHWHLGER